jgi:predicted molibdopterin-dependent oxidoreductase YjgC
MRERRNGSYEWVTLRATNVDYVHKTTGISKDDLKRILRNNKDKGVSEVKVPIGVKTFTREER